MLLYKSDIHAANDLSVICNDQGICETSSTLPLFNIKTAYPGYYIKKTVNFENKSQNICGLSFSAVNLSDSDLSSLVTLSIIKEGNVVYGGTLKNIADSKTISIGNLENNSSQDYDWNLALSQDAGNNIKNQLLGFNLIFNFSCNENQLTPTPKPGNPVITLTAFPLTSFIGETIPVYFSIENASFNKDFYYKLYGDQIDGSGKLKTIYNGALLSNTTAWNKYPVFKTDSEGKYSGIIFAKADDLVGKYSFTFSIKDAVAEKVYSGTVNYIEIINNNNQSLVEITTNSSTNECKDVTPSDAPKLLNIIPGVNSATLNWSESSDPLTYYLIAYGTTPGKYEYGNPNIGGKGTHSYTVTHLSSDKTYYFTVRAGNGCASGSFSNELSISPIGNIIAGDAQGFTPNVLGVENEKKEDSTSSVDHTAGEVAGSTVVKLNKINWLYILILIILILIFDIIHQLKRKLINKK